MDRVINTAHLPEHERFDFWRDEISKLHLQYDVQRIDRNLPFQAELKGAVLDDVIFGVACLSGVCGHRNAQHVAADSLDHYVLGIPVKQSIVMQDGVEYALSNNEMVLFDGARPLRYRHDHGQGGITLAIPRYLLETRLTHADIKGLRIAPLDHGIGLMLRSFFQTLPRVMESNPDASVRRGLAEQVVSLISLAFQASDEGIDRAKPTLSRQRFQAVKKFIDMHLQEPELNPEYIVSALGISRSYLYDLFRSNDFSFGEYVRVRRLALAAANLGNPIHYAHTITDIAVACGFNNLSHFSRCFSAQYGESPRAYRARMLNRER